MDSALMLLAAVVAGWLIQLYVTYQQSMAFNDAVRKLRQSGTVSVGVGGKRYRGGRAFVAMAVDEHGIVRDAISLAGWTTFARARKVPALIGKKAAQLASSREYDDLTPAQREAARQAATLLRQQNRSPQPTPTNPAPMS